MKTRPKSTEKEKLAWLRENKKKLKGLTDKEIYFLMVGAGLYSSETNSRDSVYVVRRLMASI